MTRLTRTQVQERNRLRMLEVARREFLRDGYVATSLASVAKEAGFTTGIVYSSFGSKADLALAVVERLQAEQITTLAKSVADSHGPGGVLERVRAWADEATASGWVRFELELLLDTIHDSRLAAAQAARQEAAIDHAMVVVRSLVPEGALDEDTMRVMAEAAVDYAIGVAIRQVTNDDASPDRFLGLLGPFFRLVALGCTAARNSQADGLTALA